MTNEGEMTISKFLAVLAVMVVAVAILLGGVTGLYAGYYLILSHFGNPLFQPENTALYRYWDRISNLLLIGACAGGVAVFCTKLACAQEGE